MTVYELTEEECISEDLLCYQTCGIAARVDGMLWDQVSDVSVNQSFVLEIIAALNRGQASILHFREIVEDFCSQ